MNGIAQLFNSTGIHLQINETIPNSAKIRFSCIQYHYVVGNDTIECQNGTWSGEFPECVSHCRSIPESYRFTVDCTLNNATVDCADPVKLGTIAKVVCKYGYETPIGIATVQEVICLSLSRWRPKPEVCTQICGEWPEASDSNNTIEGSVETKPNHLPWQATIYRAAIEEGHFVPYCGATILTAKIVLTEWYCFGGEINDTIENPFALKTGRPFREYDEGMQGTEVQRFLLGRMDKQTAKRMNDKVEISIVFILNNKYIEFNAFTSPICLDYTLELEDIYVTPGLRGVVGGWGLDEPLDHSTPKYSVVELKAISRQQCHSNSTEEFRKQLNGDRFCAETVTYGETLCTSDTGSGIAFPTEVNGKMIYYLRGITIMEPWNSVCNPNEYLKFTNIAYAILSISRITAQFHPKETYSNAFKKDLVYGGCTITEIPSNGYISSLNSLTEYEPLDFFVINYPLFVYSCKDNFTLKGNPTNVCKGGKWTNTIPECIPFSEGIQTGKFKK